MWGSNLHVRSMRSDSSWFMLYPHLSCELTRGPTINVHFEQHSLELVESSSLFYVLLTVATCLLKNEMNIVFPKFNAADGLSREISELTKQWTRKLSRASNSPRESCGLAQAVETTWFVILTCEATVYCDRIWSHRIEFSLLSFDA